MTLPQAIPWVLTGVLAEPYSEPPAILHHLLSSLCGLLKLNEVCHTPVVHITCRRCMICQIQTYLHAAAQPADFKSACTTTHVPFLSTSCFAGCWQSSEPCSHKLSIRDVFLAAGAEVVGIHAHPAEEPQAQRHECPHPMGKPPCLPACA